MARPETLFKRELFKHWSGWAESYEPGLGSGTGYPDVQFLCPSSYRLVPVELKTCKIKDGIVYPSEVRPSQCVWHYEFTKAGGRSALLMGLKITDKRWRAYAVSGHRVQNHVNGYPIESCLVIDENHIDEGLHRLIIKTLGGELQ